MTAQRSLDMKSCRTLSTFELAGSRIAGMPSPTHLLRCNSCVAAALVASWTMPLGTLRTDSHAAKPDAPRFEARPSQLPPLDEHQRPAVPWSPHIVTRPR